MSHYFKFALFPPLCCNAPIKFYQSSSNFLLEGELMSNYSFRFKQFNMTLVDCLWKRPGVWSVNVISCWKGSCESLIEGQKCQSSALSFEMTSVPMPCWAREKGKLSIEATCTPVIIQPHDFCVWAADLLMVAYSIFFVNTLNLHYKCYI